MNDWNALGRLNALLERAALAAVVVMMALMCAVTFTQAAGRYVFHFSFVWSEELSRYLMVWVSMLGGAVAARRRMHFGFDSLVAALPAALRRGARRLALVLALVTFAALTWYGVKLAHFNMAERTPALEWPMGIPYAAVPTGGALIVLFLLERLRDPA